MTPEQLVHALEVERAQPISRAPKVHPDDTPGDGRRRLELLGDEALAADAARFEAAQSVKRRNARQRKHERHRAHQRAREAAGE